MPKVLIWDLPTRIFHWALAASIGATFVFAYGFDKHGRLFQWHMLAGLIAAFLLVVRLGLGFAGSRYVQWNLFFHRPVEYIGYFRRLLRRPATHYAGHNPGTALVALLMFGLITILTVTGIGGEWEISEDVHESAAIGLAVAVGLHLLGLAFHTVHQHENISGAMVTGFKTGPIGSGISSARPWAGLILILVIATWVYALLTSYDGRHATVKIPGLSGVIHLGENEKGNHHD
ncbi:MAG: cytochrome b/b6 domain-containing protein [Opitutaceae bacterium]